LLDAVDDEDEGAGGEEEDDATVIYRPKADDEGNDAGPESEAPAFPFAIRAALEPRAGDAAAVEPPAPDAEVGSTPAQVSTSEQPRAKNGKPKRSGASGGGQALAAALALAVVVVVTLVVHYRRGPGAVSVDKASPKPPASAKVTSAEQQQAQCVAAFFPDNSVEKADDFAFLCEAVDLRSTVKQLEKRVADSKASGKAEATKLWDKLGWFELPLTTRLQQSCCSVERADRIVLPQPPPNCQSLSVVLKELTAATLSTEGMTAQTDDFEKVVECLTKENQASAYGYEVGVSGENRETFRDFLKRGATHRN
jgi:hypothetical protein